MRQFFQGADGQIYQVGDDDEDLTFGADQEMIFGDELAFGAEMAFGDDMIFGADAALAVRRAAAMKKARRAALARAAGGFMVGPKPLSGGKTLIAPFNQSVAAGAAATVTITPTRSFEVQDLSVDSNVARFFLLTGFTSGADNMFNAGGSCNMQTFSEMAIQRTPVKGFTATAGVPVLLNVQNLDVVNAQIISGKIVGQTIVRVG